jgi:transposase
MTKRKKARVYSEVFKLQVLIDYYSHGGSLTSLGRKWNVAPISICQWKKLWPVDSDSLSLSPDIILSYRMKHEEKTLSNEEILQKRISDLEHALELEKLRSRAFEKMIEIAEEEEGISILKKGGAKQ